MASDTIGNAGKWDVKKSWHNQYKDSAYVYVGGLPNELSEGDIMIVFSQFGDTVDVNMPRDQKTGKPKGFAFIAYEDQRSTVLAVDNFNGAKLLGRTLRCDHCASFHQEQQKDAENLPDHVTRKLSDRELEQKKQDILRRNEELEEETSTKESTFAAGRGTLETQEEREERLVRQHIVQVACSAPQPHKTNPTHLTTPLILWHWSLPCRRRRQVRMRNVSHTLKQFAQSTSENPRRPRVRRRGSKSSGKSASERAI